MYNKLSAVIYHLRYTTYDIQLVDAFGIYTRSLAQVLYIYITGHCSTTIPSMVLTHHCQNLRLNSFLAHFLHKGASICCCGRRRCCCCKPAGPRQGSLPAAAVVAAAVVVFAAVVVAAAVVLVAAAVVVFAAVVVAAVVVAAAVGVARQRTNCPVLSEQSSAVIRQVLFP